jgi:hypothetical protein
MSARAAKRKRTTSQGGGGKAGGGKTQRGPKGTSSESPAQGPAASKEGGAESGPVFPLTIPRPLMRLVYKEQERIEQEKQVRSTPHVFSFCFSLLTGSAHSWFSCRASPM